MTTALDEVSSTERFDVVTVNELFRSVTAAALFGIQGSTTVALTLGIYGGMFWTGSAFTQLSDTTVALAASQTNYVEANRSTGAVTTNTSAFTAGRIPLYLITTNASGITGITDYRTLHLQGGNLSVGDLAAENLTIATGTITASDPALSITQTWNSGGTTFVGADMNITNTASAATSLFQRWRVGGTALIAFTISGQVLVGTETPIQTFGSLAPAFQVSGTTSATSTAAFTRWVAGSGAAFFVGGKSRGASIGSHATVIDGEDLFFIIAEGSDGTGFQRAGQMLFEAEGTISTGIVPGRWTLSTANAAGTMTAAFQVDSSQFLYHYANFTSATAYSRLAWKVASTTLASVSGATVTATSLIPAKALVMGVNTKVTVSLGTGGGTTGYQVGDGTDADRWGNVTGTSTNTDTDQTNATADPHGYFNAANNVVITANGGNFNGTGSIRVDVFYTLTEAD